MKKYFVLMILVSLFSVFGCKSNLKKNVSQPKTTNNEKTVELQEEKLPAKTGWNDEEVVKYAKYFHQLCRNAGYTAFWWDCNELIDRKNLTCRQSIVDAIMDSYPEEEFIYHKTSKKFEEEEAGVAVHNMKTGWNLGNTLDSTSYDWRKEETDEKGWILQWGEKDSNGQVTTKAFETAWGMPETTKEMIHYVKELGFGAVRIPITWAEHIDKNNKIDSKWMARVHEVVNYVLDENLYCIINTHHDGWICASENMFNKYNKRFESVWKQIAKEFANYDERLIFSSMNEVSDENDTWNPPLAVYESINKWNQLFLDTVRSTGGNNKKRNLIISPKGCSGGDRDMQILDQVKDSVENHLIVEVHNYTPQGFCFKEAPWTKETAVWDASQFEYDLRKDFETYSRWQNKLNLPVIIGEYAAFPKKYEDYNK